MAAGACFILPAAIITSILAWAYVRFGYVPAAAALLRGIQAAVLAVIVGAIARLAKTTFRTGFLAWVSLAAAGASLAGGNELLILLGAGGFYWFSANGRAPSYRTTPVERGMPRDPMNPDTMLSPAETWGKRSYASPPEAPYEGNDVFDVFSLAPGMGLNGIAYRNW